MTLASLSLDGLAWEDLRRLGQQQVPIASGGRWTHHAAVDSGITLLELFAFLLDQQLFVMDQLSPEMQLAIMALLGDAPRTAGVARTIVAVPEGSLANPVTGQAGDVLVPLSGGPAGLTFSLDGDLLLLPVQSAAVTVAGEDRTLDLRQGRAVRLFVREDSGEPELALSVTLAAPITPTLVGREIAIALVLDDGGAVPPEWSAAAVDVPPPIELALLLGDGTGALRPAAPGWRDGTGGLRRSGLIRFAIPPEWDGRDRLQIALAAAASGHAEPPALSRVAVGSGIARHARPVRIGSADTGDAAHDALRGDIVRQTAGWLPLSGQELVLPDGFYPAIEDSLRLSLQDRAGDWQDWSRTDSLASLDGEARAHVFDRTRSRLRFGDGYAGRVPAPAQNVQLALEVGGGTAGNHPAGLEWRFVAGPAATLVSLADGTGGCEAEMLGEARLRISLALAQVTRAVTAEDHETLVETADGVARHRASVAPGFDPAFPCNYSPDSITVFVVPVTGARTSAPRADAGALAHFRAILEAARLLTTRVFVVPATIRPVEVQIEVEGLPQLPATTAAQLRDTLERYLHPALGGAAGTGWPFGHPLRPSELMRVAAGALPQGARVARVAIRLLDDPGREFNDCSDTPIGAHELIWLASLHASSLADATVGDVL